jgi:phosphoribosylformylglycinamidine synthase
MLPGALYGDTRCGAMASCSPIGRFAHARSGGVAVGTCNGFQISARRDCFRGRWSEPLAQVRAARSEPPGRDDRHGVTYGCRAGEVVPALIKHGEGCHVADEQTSPSSSNGTDRLPLWVHRTGRHARREPERSLNNIAGVSNPERNVVGLMPHPEHAVERLRGGEDGLKLFRSVQAWVGRDSRAPRRERTVVPGP